MLIYYYYFNYKVQEEPRLDFKVLNDKDVTKKTGFDRVYTTKGGKRKMVDQEDIIPGFKFGTSIIPFSSLYSRLAYIVLIYSFF